MLTLNSTLTIRIIALEIRSCCDDGLKLNILNTMLKHDIFVLNGLILKVAREKTGRNPFNFMNV